MSGKKLPVLAAKDVIRAFEVLGFALIRTSGSHHIMAKEGHDAALSIPVHSGETIGKGLLKSLIRASGHTVEEFIAATK